MSVLAGESPVNTPVSVPSGDEMAAAVGSSGLDAGHGERPTVWRSGMGEEVLSGLYREVFAAVVAAAGPVNGVELTRAVGREAAIKNEVEKIWRRAYVLEAGLAGAGEGRTVHARARGRRPGRFSGQRSGQPGRLPAGGPGRRSRRLRPLRPRPHPHCRRRETRVFRSGQTHDGWLVLRRSLVRVCG